MSDLPEIGNVLDQLRDQLFELNFSSKRAELVFEVESIEVELKVALTKSGGGDGKLKFGVLELGASGKVESGTTHTVKLKLKPKFPAGPPVVDVDRD